MSAMRINDPRVEEIEDGGMDEGRFFIHLKPGFDWNVDIEPRVSKSFNSRKEAIAALKNVKALD